MVETLTQWLITNYGQHILEVEPVGMNDINNMGMEIMGSFSSVLIQLN